MGEHIYHNFLKKATLTIFFIFAGFYATINHAQSDSDPEITVAASILPLADWCRNIVPPQTNVVCLLPNPGLFPELNIQIAKQINKSRLVVCLGYGADDWIQSWNSNTGRNKTDFLVIEANKAQVVHDMEPHTQSAAGMMNLTPLWLDPIWAQEAILILSQKLIELMPEQETIIDQNTQNYLVQLKNLHMELTEAVNRLPHKSYICFNGTFHPFAQRYGLNEVAHLSVSDSFNMDVFQYKNLWDQLSKMKNPVIFVNTQFRGKNAENLAKKLNCSVYGLDPFGSLSLPERDTYAEMIRYNLQMFEKGLSSAEK